MDQEIKFLEFCRILTGKNLVRASSAAKFPQRFSCDTLWLLAFVAIFLIISSVSPV